MKNEGKAFEKNLQSGIYYIIETCGDKMMTRYDVICFLIFSLHRIILSFKIHSFRLTYEKIIILL